MPDQATIATLLEAATGRLADCSESPRLDAELLLGRAIDTPRSYLYAHPEDTPDPEAVARFEKTVTQRLAGVPLAYITGSREFWSMPLSVTPATLVPRPETELLVDLALRDIPRKAAWALLDLGTGSGAIALALAKERALCRVVATDISNDALEVARFNARELGIANVEFLAGSWTAPVAGREFDLVASNPPYVAAADDALARLTAEPRSALAAGTDGLDAIRVLAADCPAILRPGGTLLLEHGAGQETAVAAILAEHGWRDVACHPDLAGLPRVTRAVCPRDTHRR